MRSAARPFLVAAAAVLFLAGTGRGQLFTTLFTENFEAPPGPAGTVGAYTEVDPVFGTPAPTLWHAEGSCGATAVTTYGVVPGPVPFSTLVGVPGSVFLWGTGQSSLTTGSFALPAPFSFFGVPKFNFRVNNNGWISFATPGPGFDFNSAIPSTGAPNDAIFAWWDDLVVRTGGSVRYLAVPGGDLIVEWNSEEAVPFDGSGERATFQVVLHAAPPDTIELRYDFASFVASAAQPWSATVGLEDATGAAGVDLTGAGANSLSFPPSNFLLAPLPPSTPSIPASMGSAAAAYNQGDIGIFNYDTPGAPNAGALESPVAVSTSINSALYLVFDTTREVQPGAGNSFDRSFVEIALSGSPAWTTVADVTLAPQCTGPVQTVVALLPFGLAGTSFRHRFRFDTVDAFQNAYRGWYVDNVRLDQVFATTTTAFAENFDAGSVPGVNVGTMTEENPFTSVPTDTLWHAESLCDAGGAPLPAPLFGAAAAYHQGDIGIYTFDTGIANRGAISSPLVVLPAGTSVLDFSFDYLKEGEAGGTTSFDQCFVDARPTTASPWTTVLQVAGNQTCATGPASFTSTASSSLLASLAAAGTGQFRLRFDTVDSVANGFLGWVVDNLFVGSHATVATFPSGTPCVGAGGCAPSIAWTGFPYVGNPGFQIRLEGAPPGASAILVLGASVTSPPCGFFLPFPIGAIVPGTGCSLGVCPNVILPGFAVAAGAGCGGTAVFTSAIPSTAPPGGQVFAQWIVIDASAFPSPAGISASQSLLLTLL